MFVMLVDIYYIYISNIINIIQDIDNNIKIILYIYAYIYYSWTDCLLLFGHQSATPVACRSLARSWANLLSYCWAMLFLMHQAMQYLMHKQVNKKTT